MKHSVFCDDDTPRVRDGTILDAAQLLPDRSGDGAHAVLTRGDVHVLAFVTNLVYRTDHSSGSYANE